MIDAANRTGSRSLDHDTRILLALFAFAIVVRVAMAVAWHYDGLYGQDPYAYYDQAVALAHALPRFEWPRNDFFWPSGYPLSVVAIMSLVGEHPLAGQIVSTFWGALLAPLAFLLCRDLSPGASRHAGIVAATMTAVAGLSVSLSTSVMADMQAVGLATLAAWLMVRTTLAPSEPTTTTRTLLTGMAGLALGFAIITRWQYVLLVPALLWVTIGRGLRASRVPRAGMALALLLGAAPLLAQAVTNLDRQPALIGHLQMWHPANAVAATVVTIEGLTAHGLPVALFYLEPFAHPALLMPPLGAFLVVGVSVMWRRGERRAVLFLAAWVLGTYGFLCGLPNRNLRYALGYWIPLVVWCGVGIDALWHHARTRRWTRALVLVCLCGMLWWSGRTVARIATIEAARRTTSLRVAALLPPNAPLVCFDITTTATYATDLDTVELFSQDPDSLASLLRTHGTVFVLVPPSAIETQWRGLTPATNVAWLRANTQMTTLADFPPFVLYEARTKALPPR